MSAARTIDGIVIAAVLFAITLQINLTFMASADYPGLRISAADFLLPLAALFIGVSFLRRRSAWPAWEKPFRWLAPLAMSGVMIFAFVNGYFVQGEISRWALTNKLTGWFVLMGYFGAGAWLAANHGRVLPHFIRAFVLFAMAAMAWDIAIQIFKMYGVEISAYGPWEAARGFMANRNAYGFLLAAAAALVTVQGFEKTRPRPEFYIFWLMFPAVFIFNGSRTLWVCTAFLLVVFICLDWRKSLKIILPCAAIGSSLFFLIFSAEQQKIFIAAPLTGIDALVEKRDDAQGYGHAERMDIIHGALAMFKERPLQGAGLGSALYFQRQENGQTLDVIDCTPLWILSEMGIIGLLVFAGSYALMAMALLKKAKEDAFARGIFIILLCFGIFSLFHELLYTRFLWFMLGLTLVRPRRDVQTI
ncbi:MAG: O-antigen ligase domain-containing protein [Alphaproteobacteria bacterium PRO2]|nr:O-antigen ligase domain-containing protein [Alphaproteobacteria bacterium PRO2]